MQAEFAETVVDELVSTEPTQVVNSRLLFALRLWFLKDSFLQKKKK